MNSNHSDIDFLKSLNNRNIDNNIKTKYPLTTNNSNQSQDFFFKDYTVGNKVRNNSSTRSNRPIKKIKNQSKDLELNFYMENEQTKASVAELIRKTSFAAKFYSPERSSASPNKILRSISKNQDKDIDKTTDQHFEDMIISKYKYLDRENLNYFDDEQITLKELNYKQHRNTLYNEKFNQLFNNFKPAKYPVPPLIINYFYCPQRIYKKTSYIPNMINESIFDPILDYYESSNNVNYQFNHKIDIFNEKYMRKLKRRNSHIIYSHANSFNHHPYAMGSLYYLDPDPDQYENVRLQSIANFSIKKLKDPEKTNLRTKSTRELLIKKYTNENLEKDIDSIESYISKTWTKHVASLLCGNDYKIPKVHPLGSNHVVYVGYYNDDNPEERREIYLDKLLNLNIIEIKGRLRITTEFKYIFRTFKYMRKFYGLRMNINDIHNLMNDDKRKINFINTKNMINKAAEFWMEIFHENRDRHRKNLTYLLRNENYEALSHDMSTGLNSIKEDLIFFVVENYNWYKEYPEVLKQRFTKKIDTLYKEINAKAYNYKPEPAKVTPFNDFLFQMNNKLNQYKSINKSPKYSRQTGLYDGINLKVKDYKSPINNNAHLITPISNYRQPNSSNYKYSTHSQNKNSSKNNMNTRPDIFNFSIVDYDFAPLKMKTTTYKKPQSDGRAKAYTSIDRSESRSADRSAIASVSVSRSTLGVKKGNKLISMVSSTIRPVMSSTSRNKNISLEKYSQMESRRPPSSKRAKAGFSFKNSRLMNNYG